MLVVAWPQAAQAQITITAPITATWPTTKLKGNQTALSDIKAGILLDPSGSMDIMQLLQSKDFHPFNPYQSFQLGSHGAAWIRLRVQVPVIGNNAGNNVNMATRGSDLSPWVLEIPVPALDSVQLYQVGPDQSLQPVQRAGTMVAHSQWNFSSNAPSFKLNLYAGEINDIWIRVQYPLVTQLPVLLKSEPQYLSDSRTLFWRMGLVMGSLLFLNLYVLIIVLTFRDWTHFAFGCFLSSSLATLFAYSGLSGYMFWAGSTYWTYMAVGFWQLLSSASSLLFVGFLLQTRTRMPRLAKAMMALGILILLTLPVYFFADRASIAAPALTLAMACGYLLNAGIGFFAWKQGDKSGRAVALLFTGLMLNMLLSGAAALGWIQFFWYPQTPAYVFLAIAFPLMLAEMNFKMRHQLAMQIRAQGIRSHDALTDTLNEPFLLARLRTVLNTPRKRREAAVLLVDVSNMPFLRQNFSQEVVEQTLLRAVIKIKRIFDNVDAIGRIGDNHLALVIENIDKDRINKLAVELIASGLMPAKGLKQDITIIFHFAAVLLEDYEGAADDLIPALQALCAKMSPRTQRPIRYLGNATRSSTPSSSHPGEASSSTLSAHSTQAVDSQNSSSQLPIRSPQSLGHHSGHPQEPESHPSHRISSSPLAHGLSNSSNLPHSSDPPSGQSKP